MTEAEIMDKIIQLVTTTSKLNSKLCRDKIVVTGTVVQGVDAREEGFVLKSAENKLFECKLYVGYDYFKPQMNIGSQIVVVGQLFNYTLDVIVVLSCNEKLDSITICKNAVDEYNKSQLSQTVEENQKKKAKKKKTHSLDEIEKNFSENSNNARKILKGITPDSIIGNSADTCHRLSPLLEENAKLQLTGRKFFRTDGESFTRLSSITDCRYYYDICRETYPVSTQLTIESLLGGTTDKFALEKLSTMLSINTFYKKEKVSSESFKNAIDSKVGGLENVKDTLCNAFSSMIQTDKPFKLLFIGSSGCGKELLAKTVGKIRNKPIISLAYYSYTNLVDIAGCNSTFDQSTVGPLGKKFYNVGTTDVTLIFEKIDSASHGDLKNGDPDTCLEGILTSDVYHDAWIDADISTAPTCIIATAEDEDRISPRIKAGFDKIVYFDTYSDAERLAIIKDYILPQLLSDASINPDESQFIDDNVIKYILKEFCYDEGFELFINTAKNLIITAKEKHYDILHQKLTFEEIDNILKKESLKKNPVAVISRHKDDFESEEYSIVKKMLRAAINPANPTNAKSNDDAKKQLRYIADYLKNDNSLPKFNYKSFMEELDKTHDGLFEIKKAFARSFNQMSKTGLGKALLLVSPPGQGKTTLTRSAAKAYGLPFYKISCNGVSDAAHFKGYNKSLGGSAPGKIVEALCAIGKKGVILLDEIDKMDTKSERGYATVSALLDLLDEKKFSDHFLDGVRLDVSSILFVATANSTSSIPNELYDRFEVVQIPAYTTRQKKRILVNYTIPKVIRETSECGVVKFSDNAVDLLSERYAPTSSVRELYYYTRKIIETALLSVNTHVVKPDDIVKTIGKPLKKNKVTSNINISGRINALTVSTLSGIGGITVIECVKRAESDKVTGLLENSCLESVAVARTVSESIIKDTSNSHYHIHFGAGESGVKKDGSSAGLALTMAIISCELNTPVNPHCAFTGEISVSGSIYPVGAISEKIRGAIEAGCTEVFVPLDNYTQLDEEELNEFINAVEIIPVSHISEVIAKTMPTIETA